MDLRQLGHDGLTLTVVRATTATKPPVLMVHGILASAWYFEKYQRFFAARGHDAYAVNLRGREGSRMPARLGRVSLRDFITDAADAAAMIAGAGAPPIAIGHSMGGLIVQALAERGAVRAATLLCSAPPRGIALVSLKLALKQLKYAPAIVLSRPIAPSADDMKSMALSHVPPDERAELSRRFVPDSGRVARELSIGAISIDARRVRCPLLVAAAREDQLVPAAVAVRLAKKYDAPLRMYDGHGHFIMWEPGWERPAADIANWMDGLPPRA
ncbi:MAG: alpha/beta fold hydrolase [Gemmatimonadaceae bacterium]